MKKAQDSMIQIISLEMKINKAEKNGSAPELVESLKKELSDLRAANPVWDKFKIMVG